VPDQELEVGRRRVRLTSPDKLLFPGDGVTKRDLAEYYAEIGDAIVPHLRNRPFTLKRYPYGIRGQPYFAKQAPKGKPAWVPTRQFRTWPREGGSRLVDFALVNEPAAAVWMVQMNCIDMNAWYSRVDKPERPDYVVFDLDPPESRNGFAQAIEVAHLIHEALERLELRSYVKTSGADGIHVLVPITRRSSYPETYEFAELVSRALEAEHQGLVTTEWLKKKRRGVLVDHRQNGHGKTIASAYSVRPKPGAPVSTPLRWEELGPKVRPRDFGMREALARVEKHGDLFEPVLEGGQALGPALRSLRE
jgi:bifunctional non-homologous end joining protein LigD